MKIRNLGKKQSHKTLKDGGRGQRPRFSTGRKRNHQDPEDTAVRKSARRGHRKGAFVRKNKMGETSVPVREEHSTWGLGGVNRVENTRQHGK